MQAYILKSNPGARFRFGETLGAYPEEQSNTQKTTSDYLHSDTLWSALVNMWALCSPQTVEQFITECKTGQFKLSSAFYCVEYKGENIFFLPKPVSLNLFTIKDPKKLKKVQLISKGVWEKGLLPEDWFEPKQCTLLQNGSTVALTSEIEESVSIFSIETNPKVRARNLQERENSFFYQTDLCLSHGGNHKVYWYFLVQNNLSACLHKDFEKAMQAMINFGIGGERSSGCGALTAYTEIQLDITPDAASKYSCSVSLTAPIEKEITEHALYQTIKRGGRFLEHGKCLPVIQMLREGAVFDAEVAGKIVTLRHDPPVLRYGLNLSIPLHNNFIDKKL